MDESKRQKLARLLALKENPGEITALEIERLDSAIQETQEGVVKVFGSVNELDQKKADISYVDNKVESIALTPGPRGFKGEKGDPGANGRDGVDGKDGKTIIVDKIIEKTEVIKEQPIIKTEIIKETLVKEDLTGEDIIKRINNLPLDQEKKIDAKHIKGLPLPGSPGHIWQGISEVRALELIKQNQSPVGASTFLSLSDTPSSYTGQSTKIVRVKADESGLEFINPTGEADTLSTVTARGATTSVESTFSGGLITNQLKANSSAGLTFKSNAGSTIALFGAGGGQNATFYDGVKLDAGTASRVMVTDASKNISYATMTASDLDAIPTSYLKLDQTTPQTISNGQPIQATLTASQLVATDSSKKFQTLSTSTYPSLTELTYLKGVTSAIQTQLNGKQASGSYEVTMNKENTTIDTSTTKYPTVNLLKTGLDTKQATLVSGTNIKTINSQSVLGSGNIDVSTDTTPEYINIIHTNWKTIRDADKAGYKIYGGFVDGFKDQTLVDDTASTNEYYNSTSDFYTNTGGGSDATDVLNTSWPGGGTVSDKRGVKFTTKTACTLTKVTKASGCSATIAYLMDDTFTELDSASFSGDEATFSYLLADATDYYIVVDNGGSGYDQTYESSTAYPVSGVNVDFTAGYLGGDTTDYYLMVQSITTSTGGGGGIDDMTLVSETVSVNHIPIELALVIYQKDVDTTTLNTDVKGYVSRDGGTHYDQVTLTVKESNVGGGVRLLYGYTDITDTDLEANLKWKIQTFNAKQIEVYGAGIYTKVL